MENKNLENKWLKEFFEYLLVVVIILLMTTILIIFQIKNKVWLPGADGPFHSSRIYDTAQQILHGNFSYFQMNYGGYQSGRIINAVYGPFFSYFLGGILLLAGTWVKFQILLDYLVFLIGGIGMFCFAKRAGASKWTSLLAMLLFLVTGYMGYWPLGVTFYSWGAALMPYVLIQGLKMIKNNRNQVNWLSLGCLMGLIGQVHLLSILFSAIALLPFFIYGYIYSTERKELIINILKAIALFLLLTANLWGAFLVLYPTNHMAPTHSYLLDVATLHMGTMSRADMISRLIICLIFVQIFYAVWNRKKSKINTFITLEGVAFLFLASPFFPWKTIGRIFPFLSSTLQFPHRFTPIAYPLIFAGMALSLTSLTRGKRVKKASGIIGALMLIGAIGLNIKNETQTIGQQSLALNKLSGQMERESRDKDLNKFVNNISVTNSEYLPIYKKIDALQISDIVNNDVYKKRNSYYKKALTNGKLKISWQAKKSDKQQLLPVFIYSQSRLVVNGKNKNQVNRYNAIGMPYVKNKVGNNSAILSFKVPVWFNVLLVISILSWIAVIILIIMKKIRFIKG